MNGVRNLVLPIALILPKFLPKSSQKRLTKSTFVLKLYMNLILIPHLKLSCALQIQQIIGGQQRQLFLLLRGNALVTNGRDAVTDLEVGGLELCEIKISNL